jgi:hypothetical protein
MSNTSKSGRTNRVLILRYFLGAINKEQLTNVL